MSEPSRRGRLAQLAVVAGTTLALDLWSKDWAWRTLRGVRKPVVVIDPLLEFSFSFNPGSAFGMLGTVSWARTFFIAVTVLALGYVGWLAATLPTRSRTGFWGLGLVAAGALGNLHDRLVRADELGRYGVVDFIQINYPWGGSWPTFNVADVLLLVGIALVFIAVPSRGRAEAAPTAPSPAPTPDS